MRKHITYALAIGLIAIGLMSTGSMAYAQTPQQGGRRAGPAQRLHLPQRMRDGIRTGQLTRPEVQQLRQRFGELRQRARDMRADGTLSPEERKTLRNEWRQTNRALFRMRHNTNRRNGR
jgi:hypothetical protein